MPFWEYPGISLDEDFWGQNQPSKELNRGRIYDNLFIFSKLLWPVPNKPNKYSY